MRGRERGGRRAESEHSCRTLGDLALPSRRVRSCTRQEPAAQKKSTGRERGASHGRWKRSGRCTSGAPRPPGDKKTRQRVAECPRPTLPRAWRPAHARCSLLLVVLVILEFDRQRLGEARQLLAQPAEVDKDLGPERRERGGRRAQQVVVADVDACEHATPVHAA
eukprot:6026402-Prymnesium_polylepis.1